MTERNRRLLPKANWFFEFRADNINPMEAALWVILPGFVAIASGLLSWFVMQSRMEVKLAEQRETLAELRGQIRAEKESMELSVVSAARIAEETAKRESFAACERSSWHFHRWLAYEARYRSRSTCVPSAAKPGG